MDDRRSTMAADLVDELLADRIASAGHLPGLHEATVDLLARALRTDAVNDLMRAQLRQLRHTTSSALPDAYLAVDGATEDALQRAAAGIRSARARAGHLTDQTDAVTLERQLTRSLSDDPRLALRAETARVPRPATRPRALRWSVPPVPWDSDRDDHDEWPPPGLNPDELKGVLGGSSECALVERGPHEGWAQIGLIERQSTPARRYPQRPARAVTIAVGLELARRSRPTSTLPFGSSPRWLVAPHPQRLNESGEPNPAATRSVLTRDQPLVGLVDTGTGVTGLGEPQDLLAPMPSLVDALELEPTARVCGLCLDDRHGPAVVGRTWRGHPTHDGNYQPTFPAVQGADLLLRADLLVRLRDTVGDERLRTGIMVSHRQGEN